MPYRWTSEPAAGLPPPWRLRLWPHRSLSRAGQAAVLVAAATLLALPLVAVLGSEVLWGLLPFAAATLWLLAWALARSRADGGLGEDLALWPDRIEIVRRDPRSGGRCWTAHPRFVRMTLRRAGGPVENYLTLRGGGREVELGAFLSPGERAALHAALERALASLR